MKHSTKFSVIGITLVIAIFGWIGWRWYDNRYPTWHEEVQLSDGRVIVIKQKHQYYENYGTNQSWVTFSLPEMGGEQTWHSYLRPMRVDVYEGKVYVFGQPRGPRQVQYYKYPKLHLVGFVWSGNGFLRIPFLDIPTPLRAAENVYRCVPEVRQTLITFANKNVTWCPSEGDHAEFTREINIEEYRKLADSYAALSRVANRSN